MGRPVRVNYTKISVSMDTEINDKLTEYCKKNRMYKSGVIELAIEQYLEDQE